MAITNREKVKLLAGITDVTYNNLIDEQIPVVQELISEYTHDDFISVSLEQALTHDGYEEYGSPNVTAIGEMTLTGHTITSATSIYGDFKAGDNIIITGSIRNNGYYTITGITDTEITVEEDLIDENEYMYIYLVIYSKSVSNIAARMVGYDVLERGEAQGVESERIGSYSVKYRDICGVGYPQDIVAGLTRFHRGK